MIKDPSTINTTIFKQQNFHSIQIMQLINIIAQRVLTSLTTVPTTQQGWIQVASITAMTTAAAGIGSVATGYVDPIRDYSPPKSIWKPLSAFVFPGLFEELIWRAALIPTPPAPLLSFSSIFLQAPNTQQLALYTTALVVLALHVCSHPFLTKPVYPRGQKVFSDPTFLFLATIVLGGTTLSYIVSGGSVWCAAITHGLPVALWRDYFGGEQALRGYIRNKDVEK